MHEPTPCFACGHAIDATAKVCPFCDGNPRTGERAGAQAILQEVFPPRTLSRSESVLEYARQRQAAVIALSGLAAFLLLALLHQYVTTGNERAVADSPAVPLTEITDVSARGHDAPLPMPDLDFQYDGRPRAMRTFIVEPGAVAPSGATPAGNAVQPSNTRTPAAGSIARPPDRAAARQPQSR